MAFDIPTVTTRRQIQAEEEELLLAIRLSEASALQSQQNDSAKKKQRLSRVSVTPAILKTSRRKSITPASASPSFSMATRRSASASNSRVKTPSKLNPNTSQSSITKKETAHLKESRSASVNTASLAATTKKASKRVSSAGPPQEPSAMEEEPGRRALRERGNAINYKNML